MRRQSCQKISAHGFWLEGATLARREWIALPSELARESGSRLDPMSLRAECDHLVIGLALRRLCRRTVITPRLASIPSLLLKAVLFLFVWFSQALPPGSTLGTLFFLGKFNQRFAQTLPSHSILLGHWSMTQLPNLITKISQPVPLSLASWEQFEIKSVHRLVNNIPNGRVWILHRAAILVWHRSSPTK